MATLVWYHDDMPIMHGVAMPNYGPISALTKRSCSQLSFMETPPIHSSLGEIEATSKVFVI